MLKLPMALSKERCHAKTFVLSVVCVNMLLLLISFMANVYHIVIAVLGDPYIAKTVSINHERKM